MAYVNSTRLGVASWTSRFAALVARSKENFAKRRVYAQTVEELNKLTDRELSDLGISRLSIADIAHEAAYGR